MAINALYQKPAVLVGGAVVLVLLAFGPLRSWLAGPEPLSFNDEIRPILNANCLVCHGGVKQAGEFSLLFEEGAFAPNKSGKPAIVRGRADSSELVLRCKRIPRNGCRSNIPLWPTRRSRY
jgi:Planctomycete cytochrome C